MEWNELTIAKISQKFCDGYLSDELPVYILEESLNGKEFTDSEIDCLIGFIKHVQKCWNDKVNKLEENK